MSRDIAATVSTAIDGERVEVFFAIDLLFDSPDAIYLWTGNTSKTINGNEYLGVGDILNISGIQETAQISARGVTLSLAANSELVALALANPYQNRECIIYFGIVGDEDNMTEVFSGYMDTMNIEEGAELSTIELTVENRLIDLERARVLRYTDAYQKSAYPGDQGLEYVASLQEQRLPWGRGGASGTSGIVVGGGGSTAPTFTYSGPGTGGDK